MWEFPHDILAWNSVSTLGASPHTPRIGQENWGLMHKLIHSGRENLKWRQLVFAIACHCYNSVTVEHWAAVQRPSLAHVEHLPSMIHWCHTWLRTLRPNVQYIWSWTQLWREWMTQVIWAFVLLRLLSFSDLGPCVPCFPWGSIHRDEAVFPLKTLKIKGHWYSSFSIPFFLQC